jgi:hypothetical protein
MSHLGLGTGMVEIDAEAYWANANVSNTSGVAENA